VKEVLLDKGVIGIHGKSFAGEGFGRNPWKLCF